VGEGLDGTPWRLERRRCQLHQVTDTRWWKSSSIGGALRTCSHNCATKRIAEQVDAFRMERATG
jgi:hypothetical protein